MKRFYIFACCIALFLSQIGAEAQSFFDFDFPGFSMRETSREPQRGLELDYDLDFNYYLDARRFSASSDIFMASEIVNVARLSPSIGLRFSQGRGMTHRIMAGVDVTKDLGANPISVTDYSRAEDAQTLRNLQLFKDIFFYYSMETILGSGVFNLYAGIFPRSMMEGDYSRAFYSDAVKIYYPNLEGSLAKYRTAKLYAELGWNLLGYKEIDRKERYQVFTAGSYAIFPWMSAGWAASYMHIGSAYFGPCNVDHAMANPYLKFDFGQMTGIQELSLKAGALASYQQDHRIDEAAHFPMGVEGVITARHWDVGIENTVFYGDNMMPFKSLSYTGTYKTGEYNSLLYLGEPFYYTHRGYPAFYDRVELFYEPQIAPFLKARVSGVAHFINPAASIDAFIGWQAKASLIFDLDAIRHPAARAASSAKSSRTKSSSATSASGPAIKL